ncbi:MAG: glycogen synthase GlgA [Nitrospinae bacterium]|nr:glycogen synthase GlgA [Nitrospinota bacterium]
MKILIASPEIVPFAKTGGLADVTGALPKAIERLGEDVAAIMPKYKTVDEKKFGLEYTGKNIRVPISNRIEEAKIYQGYINSQESGGRTGVPPVSRQSKIPIYFIEKNEYYDREYLYGTPQGDYPDNAERFIYFSRAVLEACKVIGFKPDIIHCNDWQTGMVPVYLKTLYKDDPFFKDTAAIFTVHNIGYQGLFWHFDMHLTNLGWDIFTPEGIEFYGKINILKGGIIYSDVITAVSKTYSLEIQTEEYGRGLDGVLRKRKDDLYGVINGIDYEEWNPETDKHLAARYSIDDLSGKWECKKDLLNIYGLTPSKEIPVIAAISRLDEQKGFDLITEVIADLMKLEFQFIFLGTGKEKYQKIFEDIGKKYPLKAGIKIGFDNALAHKIEAGADMFLMPSRYEPCGLNQLYSFKYGTIPIVRATGGLNDTVENYDPTLPRRAGEREGNGFKFSEYSSKELLSVIERAVDVYNDHIGWKELMNKAMGEDYSWGHSAREYVDLYRKAKEKKEHQSTR